MSDRTQKQFETILREFALYAGAQERTAIYPGAEVIDDSYTADRIIVRGRQGYYEPALTMPGVTYTNGDIVAVLYVQGAEPIALAQAPGSGGGGGSGGWPFTGKVITVDTTDADADHATIAAAIAAAGAGDTILLSSESIGCVNQTLPDGVHLGCIGPSAAILTNSTNAITLNVGDGSVVFNIEVRNTYATSAVYGIYMPTNTDTSRFYHVTSAPDNSGGSGNAFAFYIGGASELVDCRGITNAAAFGYGFVGVGTGTKHIRGGYFDGTGASGGDDINNQAGAVTVENPILANASVDTLLGATGTQGVWMDTSGNLYMAGTTRAISGTKFNAPTLGASGGTSRWGNIYLAPNTDIYTLFNDLGLGNRVDSLEVWDEHFDGLAALPAGWAWAGAPFVTPDVISYDASRLTLGYTVGAARSFLYKAHDGTTDTSNYTILLATNSNNASSYGGVRLDDGSDNNYAEAIIQIAGSASWTCDVVYNSGGGGRTTTTGSTFYHPISVIQLNAFGTRWSNWNLNAMVRGLSTAGEWPIRTASVSPGLGFTPSRQGIIINWTGTAFHRWYVDAFVGD